MTFECPRCTGAVVVDKDHYGWRAVCISCGRDHAVNVRIATEADIADRVKFSSAWRTYARYDKQKDRYNRPSRRKGA